MLQISFRSLILTIIGAYFIGMIFTGLVMGFYHHTTMKTSSEDLKKMTTFAETLRESAVFFDQHAVAISAKAMYALEQKDYPGAEQEVYDLLQFHILQLRKHADRPEILRYLSTLQEASISSPGLKKAIWNLQNADKKQP